MKTLIITTTKVVLVISLVLMSLSSQAQVLDLESTTEGALLPRMTTAQRTAITAATLSPAEMVYDTDTKSFWYWEDMQWNELAAGSGPSAPGDEIKDADNDTKIQVEKGTDDDIIRFDIGGTEHLQLSRNVGTELLIEPKNNFFNVFLGDDSGRNVTTGAFASTFVGAGAGQKVTSGDENTMIGTGAGSNITTLAGNTMIGRWAGRDMTGQQNTILGAYAGQQDTLASYNTMIGTYSGQKSSGTVNTFLGYGSGLNNNGNYNVFLGRFAGQNNVGSNRLYIANSNTTNPLIYGEFDNNYLRIGGRLAATGGFTDADNDTKIQVEESADEDLLRVDIGGTELLTLSKSASGRLLSEPRNGFFGTFYGFDAGRLATGDSNTLFGHQAGKSITSGPRNTIMGTQAGENVTTGKGNNFFGKFSGRMNNGNDNVFIGDEAGINNTGSNSVFLGNNSGQNSGTSSNSVFIGRNSGRFETNNNRLYVDNSNTTTPLIYGEFDNNKLGINTSQTPGTFQITNPDSDKTSMYLLPKEISGSEDSSSVFFAEDFDADYGMEILYDGVGNELQVFGHNFGTVNGPHFQIKRDDGRVAIGDDFATGYKLSVDGKVACEEVLVDLSGDWPDYVFQPEYELKSLEEVRNHINEKGHLPGVPSAQEVEENGIKVGEMNKVLMEKVEELTLYIIDLEARLKNLENK